MYAWLKGKIAYRSPALLVMEVGGIGYNVHIPLSTFSATEGKDEATIYTSFIVREDSQSLYGFATAIERNVFEQLLSVTGVGPNTAQLVLSSMTVDEIRAAVIGEQAHVLQKVKGIGAKTAKQIILDLKDKMSRESGHETGPLLAAGMAGNSTREEALSALVALGFNRIAVQKALNTVLREQPNASKVEELIKLALKQLS